MNPILASSLPTKKFIDPDSYSVPFLDLALQNVSQCLLRSPGDSQYTLGPSLGNLGWRARKHYFKVSPRLPNTKHSHQANALTSVVTAGAGNRHGKVSADASQPQHYYHHPQHPHQHLPQQQQQMQQQMQQGGGGGAADVPFGPNDFLVTWTEFGADKFLDDKEIHGMLKLLQTIRHPFIQQVEYTCCNENGVLVVKR